MGTLLYSRLRNFILLILHQLCILHTTIKALDARSLVFNLAGQFEISFLPFQSLLEAAILYDNTPMDSGEEDNGLSSICNRRKAEVRIGALERTKDRVEGLQCRLRTTKAIDY